MAQYGWTTCPATVRNQLRAFCEETRTLLKDNLIGIYLHGSLAMDCFNPEHSDLDLLVVTHQQMPVEIKRQCIELLLRISNKPAPIEISYLVMSDIHPFRHPLPFDLHYSESWRQRMQNELANGTWQRWNDEPRHDGDLAAHLTITRARGIMLYGSEAISTIFPPVPASDYVTSIIGDYTDARQTRQENPVYFVLNACRVHAFLHGRHIYSKDEGGIYGLEHLPSDLHTLIGQALKTYRGEQSSLPLSSARFDAFIAYMDKHLL